jgi:hypothetical protein
MKRVWVPAGIRSPISISRLAQQLSSHGDPLGPGTQDRAANLSVFLLANTLATGSWSAARMLIAKCRARSSAG